LSAPAVLAKAAAPLALAGLWSAVGEPKVVFGAVLILLLAGLVGLFLATRAQQARVSAEMGAASLGASLSGSGK
jgi:hypothetical protein